VIGSQAARSIGWGVLSFMAYLGSAIVAFAPADVTRDLLRLLAGDTGAGTVWWGVRLAIWVAAWGFIATAGVAVLARWTLGLWPRASTEDRLLLLVGAGLATVVQFALHEWIRAKFGAYDIEYAGWTAGLPAALIAAAVSAFAARTAPPWATLPPRVALGFSAAGVLFIVGSNGGGLGDGIRLESWPLAILVGGAGLYALLVLAAELARTGEPAGV